MSSGEMLSRTKSNGYIRRAEQRTFSMNSIVNFISEYEATRLKPDCLSDHISVWGDWFDSFNLGNGGCTLVDFFNRGLFETGSTKSGNRTPKEKCRVERGALHQLNAGVAANSVDGVYYVFETDVNRLWIFCLLIPDHTHVYSLSRDLQSTASIAWKKINHKTANHI